MRVLALEDEVVRTVVAVGRHMYSMAKMVWPAGASQGQLPRDALSARGRNADGARVPGQASWANGTYAPASTKYSMHRAVRAAG